MSRKYRIRNQEKLYFVTFTIVEWIDVFTRKHYKDILIEFLLHHFRQAGAKNPNNSTFQIWQQHNHPIELNSNDKITRCLNYIHQNPVVAGIVFSAEDYVYSSASNYAGLPEKLIDVLFIE